MDGTRRPTRLGSIPSATWLPLILLLQAVPVCIAGETPDRAVSESANVLIDVRAVPDSLGALYTVKCFDGEHKFMVDTGCSITVLDAAFRPRLGDVVRKGNTPDGIGLDIFAAPRLELGGIVLGSEAAVSQDLRQISRILGHEITGIVGMDALSPCVLEVDLASERLRVLREVPDETRRRDERLKMRTVDGGVWFVSARLPDGEEEFLLDTGSDGEVKLSPDRFKRLQQAKSIRDCIESPTFTVRGKELSLAGELSEIQLGTHHHLRLNVDTSDLSALGRSYLRRFVVTFDFREGDLYLRPSKDYLAGDPRERRSGLEFTTRRNQIVLSSVERGSPAYSAGLRKGDQILRIHGRSTKGLPEGRIRAILSRDGEEVEIAGIRNGKNFACKFKLRNLAVTTKKDNAAQRSPADTIPR